MHGAALPVQRHVCVPCRLCLLGRLRTGRVQRRQRTQWQSSPPFRQPSPSSSFSSSVFFFSSSSSSSSSYRLPTSAAAPLSRTRPMNRAPARLLATPLPPKKIPVRGARRRVHSSSSSSGDAGVWTSRPARGDGVGVREEDGLGVGAGAASGGADFQQAAPREKVSETQLASAPRRIEDVVRAVRRRYGDRVPAGVLEGAEERRVYERLYGAPLEVLEERGEEEEVEEGVEGYGGLEEGGETVLLESEDGGGEVRGVGIVADAEVEVEHVRGMERVRTRDADARVQEDIEAAFGAEAARQETDTESARLKRDGDEDEYIEDVDETQRTHPLTLGGRFSTSPSTTQLPAETMVDPIAHMLAETSNKHLKEAALETFAGAALPNANAAPVASRTMPQKPIPLSAWQTQMTEMEARLYMAVLLPGNYAVATSILTEVRKRLGTEWIERLINSNDGPRILDAGAGGGAALAWHDILLAEWARMQEGKEDAGAVRLGKSTVLTGSDPLRHRVSRLLDNTTFLPRLPDYIHSTFGDDSPRKQFEIVIAPHSLWHIQEPHLRDQQLRNLWSLVHPDGGVLIIWEKGIPRGFEAIADARQYLLDKLFTPPNAPVPAPPPTADHPPKPAGTIVAPCTNHGKCPMYTVPGLTQRRKDYCHFEQRYLRPPFLQRVLGAHDRNHEDLPFSYLAVQKGRHPPPHTYHNEDATAAAFAGYDLPASSDASTPGASPTTANPAPHLYAHLPRLLLPPLKRRGHVILDVCTPAAQLERWTVPRSFGHQAYRDARKAAWGDLWALGAKTRVARVARVGARKARRAGRRGVREGEEDEEEEEEEDGGGGRHDDKHGDQDHAGGEGRRKGRGQRQSRSQSDDQGNRNGAGRGPDAVRTVDIAARRPKLRGRAKARKRRREETAAIFARGGAGDGDA